METSSTATPHRYGSFSWSASIASSPTGWSPEKYSPPWAHSSLSPASTLSPAGSPPLNLDSRLFSAAMVLLFVLNPYFCYWSFSGMETLTAAGLALWAVVAATSRPLSLKRFLLGCALVGVGPLLRPEMVFFAAILALVLFYRRLKTASREPSSRLSSLAGFASGLVSAHRPNRRLGHLRSAHLRQNRPQHQRRQARIPRRIRHPPPHQCLLARLSHHRLRSPCRTHLSGPALLHPPAELQIHPSVHRLLRRRNLRPLDRYRDRLLHRRPHPCPNPLRLRLRRRVGGGRPGRPFFLSLSESIVSRSSPALPSPQPSASSPSGPSSATKTSTSKPSVSNPSSSTISFLRTHL